MLHSLKPAYMQQHEAERHGIQLSRWLLPALVLAAALLRLLWLDADAATTLSWSSAPFTDEGLYSHAARNRVLFGTWRINEWDNRLVSPLFDGLAYIVYTLFGVGYVQLRLINVVFASLALPLFWCFLRDDWGAHWALIASALWAFDYFWFQNSRLGLLEPGLVALLVVAAWCWRRAIEGSWSWAIGCGVCVAAAFVWKSLALIFLPAPLLALLLLRRFELAWQVGGGYVLGLTLGLSVYGIAWYLPNQAEIAALQTFYAADRIPPSWTAARRMLEHNLLWRHQESHYIWGQTPVFAFAGMLGLGRALVAAVRGTLPPSIALCVAWLMCGLVLLIMPYSPPRYFSPLLPPLVVLAVYAVRYTDNLYLPYISRPFAGLLLVSSFGWSGWWYARWAAERETTLIDSSRTLQRIVPRDAVVLGVPACALSLANELRCIAPFAGLVNDERPVERYGAQYALVELNNPDDYVRREYAQLLKCSKRLPQLQMGTRRVTLMRLPGPTEPASTCSQQQRVPDDERSNRD